MSTLVDALHQVALSAPRLSPPLRARNLLTTRWLTFSHETALSLAWPSPTNWLYGHRVSYPRAASLYRPRNARASPLYQLFEAYYEDVKAERVNKH